MHRGSPKQSGSHAGTHGGTRDVSPRGRQHILFRCFPALRPNSGKIVSLDCHRERSALRERDAELGRLGSSSVDAQPWSSLERTTFHPPAAAALCSVRALPAAPSPTGGTHAATSGSALAPPTSHQFPPKARPGPACASSALSRNVFPGSALLRRREAPESRQLLASGVKSKSLEAFAGCRVPGLRLTQEPPGLWTRRLSFR